MTHNAIEFPFWTERPVEFCQTDAGGILHFSVYYQLMEQAEHAMHRAAGTSVATVVDDCEIGWPRVSAKCDFSKPARFEQVIKIEIGISRLGRRSVTYLARLSIEGEEIAQGEMTSVCCAMGADGPTQSMEIPASLRSALAPYVLNIAE